MSAPIPSRPEGRSFPFRVAALCGLGGAFRGLADVTGREVVSRVMV